jgi:hypothetical protein
VIPLLVLLAAGMGAGDASAQAVEKLRLVSITSADLKGGIVTELTWVDGVLTVQGAFLAPSGEIKAEYFVVPAEGTELRRLTGPSDGAEAYWRRKASRQSPTGIGRITSATDAKMPFYGVGSLDRRLRDAADIGGVQQRHVLTLRGCCSATTPAVQAASIAVAGGVEPHRYVDGRATCGGAPTAGSRADTAGRLPCRPGR